MLTLFMDEGDGLGMIMEMFGPLSYLLIFFSCLVIAMCHLLINQLNLYCTVTSVLRGMEYGYSSDFDTTKISN